MSALDRIRRKVGVHKADQPLACSELVEIITDYLEGALSPGDRVRFERHVAGCEGCATYLEQIRQTIRVVGRLSEATIPARAGKALLVAFRTWKEP